jgi:hypothetical protein
MTGAHKFSMQWYLKLMYELTTRIDLVAHACDGKLNLPPPYAREYAYLQFRRMCELIALGCLHLHGDLPRAQTKAARKEWNAERIMRLLRVDHPHAFPQCCVRVRTTDGWDLKANSNPNALTLEEFNTLYAECGEVLHRGTIRTLDSVGPPSVQDYEKVVAWRRKVVDLMSHHGVQRKTGSSFYFVSLKDTSAMPACSLFTIGEDGNFHVHTITTERAIGKSASPDATYRPRK